VVGRARVVAGRGRFLSVGVPNLLGLVSIIGIKILLLHEKRVFSALGEKKEG
jgi:hypothetical protein